MRQWSGLRIIAVTVAALCVCAVGGVGPRAAGEDSSEAAKRRRAKLFDRLDVNGDDRLSLQEYMQRGDEEPQVLQRDFELFDFSGDGKMTPLEFAATPGFARFDVPDPYEGLLDLAIEAMDQSYDGWNLRPEQGMNSTFFAINFAASLATDNRRRLDREIVSQADPNEDHLVTREEAKQFLEVQLGIRWKTGDRLRLTDGRVVNFARFLNMDVIADDKISMDEFIENWWRPHSAKEDFQSLDRDRNQELSLAEFAHPDGPNLVDPIAQFRAADTNLDGQLDVEELNAAVALDRKNLISSSLSGFDYDDNQKLSLTEYRLSMLGNFNYDWPTVPKDGNNDDTLSFEEFVFSNKRDLFQLQRRFFFHRLDVDSNKKLSVSEFEFKSKGLTTLVLVSTESGEMSDIYKRKEFPTCGSPAVSPDGQWIAFDAVPLEGVSKSRVLKMNLDGKNVHNLCD
ncbi:MAG: hypothetical protein MI861_22375, partial [Pirellulales bacterium]|nr:hypothetical protein [Pirellulales bacterium]